VKIGVLLHEPGKKPEQSGLYSPSPVETCVVRRQLYTATIEVFCFIAIKDYQLQSHWQIPWSSLIVPLQCTIDVVQACC